VSDDSFTKLTLPTTALVTVTTAPDTVAEKSAWPLIVFFKFVAVVSLFVWTWNSLVDGDPVVEVKTIDVLSFFLK